MSDARYAIYFVPDPASALWDTASALLGYDAATGREVTQRVPPGIDVADWRALTEEPRRYGFHATLKAPFRLRAGVDEGRLRQALTTLAAERTSSAAVLTVTLLTSFAALVPGEPAAAPALATLADAAVDAFEPFRAPLTEADRIRRKPHLLTGRQRELLDRFGYPYVREEFRFHMTLTGRGADARPDLVAKLEELLEPVLPDGGTPIDGIALVRQDTATERFRIIAREPLRSP